MIETTLTRTGTRERCRLIARRVITEHARDRLTCALYEAVVEGLDFGPRDLPRPEDRTWIRGMIAAPMQEAADAALEVLAASLRAALADAPDGLLDRFERSHYLEDLGVD